MTNCLVLVLALYLVLSINLVSFSHGHQHNPDELKTYIVHVSRPPSTTTTASPQELEAWHKTFLPGGNNTSRLVYSYGNVVGGFAARLSEAEMAELRSKDGFVRAHPDRIIKLHTTRSPSFLGLHRGVPGLWEDSNYGRGVIIGVMDTGVSPGHPSFRDGGMPPPPRKWRGACEFKASGSCNRKLIGARVFLRAMSSWEGTDLSVLGPYDDNGHGTHTASTAAGTFVAGASVGGLANGTACGVAPLAHLAIYKVCFKGSCADADVLAAMDAAVHEGVDVISVSLGGFSQGYFDNGIAIGALGAVEKGVFVSCSAGNDGPYNGTVDNGAPWILTVGAASMDRVLRSTVVLGPDASSKVLLGESAYQPSNFSSTRVPLVYPAMHSTYKAAFCLNGSLDGIDVRGKLVLCDEGIVSLAKKGRAVKEAGGLGMIVPNYNTLRGYSISVTADGFPTARVSFVDGLLIKAYAASARSPTASVMFNGTSIGTVHAPTVAYFSSRGPNLVDPSILKPDIVGPGLNVLAAWPAELGQGRFNIISGTSMSAPHLSGIAALLKSAHPDWSPAAIKSAIMTTASQVANDGKPILDESSSPAGFLEIGAGHVNPSKAANPGLIYDIKFQDYVKYLYGLNYTKNQLNVTVRADIPSSMLEAIDGRDLNLPSIMVFLNATNSYTAMVKRRVTNVGAPSSSYTVTLSSKGPVKVDVSPKELSFSSAGETEEYTVVFMASIKDAGKVYQGYLTWVSSSGSGNGNITVGSPIVMVVDCGDQCLW